MKQVSPLAYVHPDARLAADVVVEPFAVIHGDVQIDAGTRICSHAVIDNGARIGKNCTIFPGAVVSTIPQDLKFAGEYTTVEIGDHVQVRECVTIHRGTSHSERTVIGNHVLLMAYVHVAHDCVVGDHVILANSTNLAGHVVIEEHAVIGGLCGVHQFCKVGRHAMVSAHCMVRKDVPPYILAGREPLSYTGVNTRGLQRRNFSAEDIQAIREMYRILYLSGHNITQALQKIETEFPITAHRDAVLGFIRGSKRGVIRSSSGSEGEDED